MRFYPGFGQSEMTLRIEEACSASSRASRLLVALPVAQRPSLGMLGTQLLSPLQERQGFADELPRVLSPFNVQCVAAIRAAETQ